MEEDQAHAAWLGMDQEADKDLFYIAKVALEARVPPPWKPCKTPEGDIFWTHGHNARPVAEGQCCSDCNYSVVVPARLRA